MRLYSIAAHRTNWQKPRVSWGFCHFWSALAIRCMRLLRRFLRHKCAGFCAALGCPVKVGVGHLQIMLQGDAGRVAQPRRHDVDRVVFCQFGFATGPHGMEQSGPGYQTGALNDAVKLRSQVAVPPAVRRHRRLAIIARDNKLSAIGGQFKGFCQDGF